MGRQPVWAKAWQFLPSALVATEGGGGGVVSFLGGTSGLERIQDSGKTADTSHHLAIPLREKHAHTQGAWEESNPEENSSASHGGPGIIRTKAVFLHVTQH